MRDEGPEACQQLLPGGRSFSNPIHERGRCPDRGSRRQGRVTAPM